MTPHTVRTMFDSYAEIATKALDDGKRVEFQERMVHGAVYLVAKISPRPEVPAKPADGGAEV